MNKLFTLKKENDIFCRITELLVNTNNSVNSEVLP